MPILSKLCRPQQNSGLCWNWWQNAKPLSCLNLNNPESERCHHPQTTFRLHHTDLRSTTQGGFIVNNFAAQNSTALVILNPSYRTYSKKSDKKSDKSKGSCGEKLVTSCGKPRKVPKGCEKIVTPQACKKAPPAGGDPSKRPADGGGAGGGPNMMVILGAAAAAAIIGLVALMMMNSGCDKGGAPAGAPTAAQPSKGGPTLKPAFGGAGDYKAGLPTYTSEQVSKHNNPQDGIWFSWREGVYDMTNYIWEHPGGPQISKAYGSSTDHHFEWHRNHYHPDVLKAIENLRIGNLDPADVKRIQSERIDPYTREPTRDPRIHAVTLTPWNATCPYDLLVQNFFTPNELHYVRSHLPVPVDLTEDNYELEISVEGKNTTKVLKMADIKKLPKFEMVCTLQCNGARRDEMRKVKFIYGLELNKGAISNAKWGGCKLRDVLNLVGVSDADEVKFKHVQAESYDEDGSGQPYGGSITFYKAMDPKQDTILAYEMNGKPLPQDHGFPCRLLVPGVCGARSIKWLARLMVSSEESPLHFQKTDYKGFSPNTDFTNVDWENTPAIQNLPVNSAICVPAVGSDVSLKDGKLHMAGWAYSGGGEEIVRVDVTADGGKNWHVATIDHVDSSEYPRHWGWALWSASIPVPSGAKEVELWAKAVNRSFNCQPETFENNYNFRGVLCTPYDRVKVNVK